VRRIVCIVIALIVLAPTLAVAQAYRCRGDGRARAACCCPGAPRDPSDAPSMTRSCCCDVIDGVAPTTNDRATSAAGLQAPPILAAVIVPPPEPPAPRLAAPTRLDDHGAPPAPPDPLFLRHCSLLL
jgi:hypothetical protein